MSSKVSNANDESEETQNERNIKHDMAAIRRDLLVLSAGFGMLCASLGTSQDVQRALGSPRELEVTVRGLFISSRLVSCALLTTVAVEKLGSKGALLVAYSIHVVYLLATLDPRFSTLIPCSIAAGITSPLLWVSLGIYITSLAIGYTKNPVTVKQSSSEPAVNKFFCVFFAILFVSFLVPAILSSVVLSPDLPGRINQAQLDKCGLSYCNQGLKSEVECKTTTTPTSINVTPTTQNESCWETVSIISVPPMNHAYVIGGLYVSLAFVGGVLILYLVRNIVTGQTSTKLESEIEAPLSLKRSVLDSLGATFEILRDNPLMFLLAFAAFCYGSFEYFFVYDFPAAFVLCVSGYHIQGFLLFAAALSACVTSGGTFFIRTLFFRLWMVGIATVFVYLCILPLFIWKPSDSNKGLAFILAVMWGVVTSLWNILLAGIHGHLGRHNMSASFANLLFWWSLGQLVGFVWSELGGCIDHKLYVLTPLLAGATIALVALEFLLRPPFFASKCRVAPISPESSDSRGIPEGISRSSPVSRFKTTNAMSVTEKGLGPSRVDKPSGKLGRERVDKPETTNVELSPTAPPIDDVIPLETTDK